MRFGDRFPDGRAPASTNTVTSVCSLAVPLNDGVESLVGEEIAFSVTTGLTVCTVKAGLR